MISRIVRYNNPVQASWGSLRLVVTRKYGATVHFVISLAVETINMRAAVVIGRCLLPQREAALDGSHAYRLLLSNHTIWDITTPVRL